MELLVVIGIIAVLISILLPSLAKARQSAQSVQCMAMMRQVGMAFRMYANDNKDRITANFGRYLPRYLGYSGLPLPYNCDVTIDGPAIPVRSWLRGRSILACPAMIEQMNGYMGTRDCWRTVAMGRFYVRDDGSTSFGPIKSLNDTPQPSQTLLAACAGALAPYTNTANKDNQVNPGIDPMVWATPRMPHGGKKWLPWGDAPYGLYLDGKENVLFFDMHVEPQTIQQMYLNAPGVAINFHTNGARAAQVYWKGKY